MDLGQLLNGYQKKCSFLSFENFLMNFSHQTTLIVEIKKDDTPHLHQKKKVDLIIELIKNITLPEREKQIYNEKYLFLI